MKTAARLLRRMEQKEERGWIPHAITDSRFGPHTSRSVFTVFRPVRSFLFVQLNSSELTHSVAQSSEDIEDVVLLHTQRRQSPKGNMNRTGALNVHPHSLKRGQ